MGEIPAVTGFLMPARREPAVTGHDVVVNPNTDTSNKLSQRGH